MTKIRIPTTRTLGLSAAVLAAMSAGLPAAAAATGPADVASAYRAQLAPLNHSAGHGTTTLALNGNTAVLTETVSGLPASFKGKPYPHVQHIHVDGAGNCPTPAADTNHDGVISTTEGTPAYGPIGTSLTTKGDTSPKAGTDLATAPAGASFTYTRTIDLDTKTADAIRSGKAVIVVHGLDPASLDKKAQQEKSDLVPTLPLAATSPALCGVLQAVQNAPTG